MGENSVDLTDEKDYVMRRIQEMARVLFSLLFGKEYQALHLPEFGEAEVSGRRLGEYLEQADRGEICEAENAIWEDVDPANAEEMGAVLFFYEHLASFSEEFLTEHRFSREEVLDGFCQIARETGYEAVTSAALGAE